MIHASSIRKIRKKKIERKLIRLSLLIYLHEIINLIVEHEKERNIHGQMMLYVLEWLGMDTSDVIYVERSFSLTKCVGNGVILVDNKQIEKRRSSKHI